MGFTELFGEMKENVAVRLLPTSDLQELKSENEACLRDAYDADDESCEPIAQECEANIDRIENELARRSR